MDYTTEIKEARVDVADFLKDYVDVEKFLGFCKQCENYNVRWACPPYDFAPLAFWQGFRQLKIVGVKILFDPGTAGKQVDHDDCVALFQEVLQKEAKQLYKELRKEEKAVPGATLLYAGCCHLCGDKVCDRNQGPCRHPQNRRYSLESLGGDVAGIAKDFLGFDLLWIENGKMPAYLCLVGGILYQ